MLLLGHTFGMRPSFLLPSPTIIPKGHFHIDVCIARFSPQAGHKSRVPDADPTKITDAVYGRVDGLIIPLTAYHNVVDNIINLLTALKISVNSIVGNAVDSINYIC